MKKLVSLLLAVTFCFFAIGCATTDDGSEKRSEDYEFDNEDLDISPSDFGDDCEIIEIDEVNQDEDEMNYFFPEESTYGFYDPEMCFGDWYSNIIVDGKEKSFYFILRNDYTVHFFSINSDSNEYEDELTGDYSISESEDGFILDLHLETESNEVFEGTYIFQLDLDDSDYSFMKFLSGEVFNKYFDEEGVSLVRTYG